MKTSSQGIRRRSFWQAVALRALSTAMKRTVDRLQSVREVEASAAQVASPGAPRRRWTTKARLAVWLGGAGITLGLVAVLAGVPGSLRRAHVEGKSIAVLPFANLSGRSEDAYLADGLQEEILNALSRLRDLKVISRTSVREYRGRESNIREIGQRLGVAAVLEGSVRREGDTLRLAVQLIDARSDRHLLAANYDRDLTRVLDLQSAVARQVASALAVTLTLYERGELERVATNSGDAYDRYLRALALFRRPSPDDQEGLKEPKRLLEEALHFDPDYADALALLSRVDTWTYATTDENPAYAAAAKQAFERALAIDPNLPEARLARGLYSTYVAKNLDPALADLGEVVALRPNAVEAHAVLAFALRRRGRMEEALRHFERAWDLDPLNKKYAGGPFVTLLGLRRYPEAIKQTEIYATRFPDDPKPYFVRARLQAHLQHDVGKLLAALRDHGDSIDPATRRAFEAEVAQAEGRYLDAVRILEALPAVDPLERGERIGFLYLVAGDPAHAEQSFRRARDYALGLQQREPQSVDLAKLAVVQSMLGEHAAALATIELARARAPEARDAINGPAVSFARSFILVRAGRTQEGYSEVARLLRVPFGAPIFKTPIFTEYSDPVLLGLKDDPHFDELVNHPPRL